jgi:uncharacterized membrane protein YdbT with pleckstrin-like domain
MSYLDSLLAAGERVVLRTRRHGIVLVRTIGVALVVILAGLGLALFFGVLSGSPGSGAGLAAWGGLGLALLGAVAALPAWLRWRSEEYLVTDRRVIQVEGVFQKRVLDSSLDKVNDVLLAQSVAGRLLGYGTIDILTASEQGINRLETIPDPLGFKRAMLEARSAQPAITVAPAAAAPPPVGTRTASAPAAPGAAARLAELEEMRRRELVSEDEYRAKRREILEGL